MYTVCIAEYDSAMNDVRETRLFVDQDITEVMDLFETVLSGKAVYAYIPGCVDWDNPYYGMVITQEYEAEYKKLIDD